MKVEKRQRYLEGAPVLEVGKASFRAIDVLVGEVVKMAEEAAAAADEATRTIEEGSEVSH